jgi:hypothetical protein
MSLGAKLSCPSRTLNRAAGYPVIASLLQAALSSGKGIYRPDGADR